MADKAQSDTPPLPAGLAALVARAGQGGGKKPPVDLWNPPFCGQIDMRIAGDGRWFYMGTPILRPALVNLFASVLRREADGSYCLVTPVEKVGISVDDAPFLAVELFAEGPGAAQVLTLRTNVGDVVRVGADHGLRFAVVPENDGIKPYVQVRRGLEALLVRPLLYELAELMVEHEVDGAARTGVWSSGVFFAVD